MAGNLCAYVYLEQAFSMPIIESISVIEMKYKNAEIVEITTTESVDKPNGTMGFK